MEKTDKRYFRPSTTANHSPPLRQLILSDMQRPVSERKAQQHMHIRAHFSTIVTYLRPLLWVLVVCGTVVAMSL